MDLANVCFVVLAGIALAGSILANARLVRLDVVITRSGRRRPRRAMMIRVKPLTLFYLFR